MSIEIKRPISPARYLFIGFFSAIVLGSLLLSLPISSQAGTSFRYVDALFTSVSAVCVTGLATVDIASTLTIFGKVVLALLIMIGGMGVATMIISIALFLGLRVGVSGRSIISESYNLGTLKGAIKVLKVVVFTSLIVQLLGMIGFYPTFRKTYSPLVSLGHSAFHAISSFNNAGFDILRDTQSIDIYRGNISFLLITIALIVVGGLGFFVIADVLHSRFRWKQYTMHTKMVLTSTALLIVGGFAIFFFSSDKSIIESLFLSVTSRTAGFSTLDISSLYQVELWSLIILMFIGASPGSTGGGVKTTTIFTLLLSLFPLQRKKEVAIFSRRISSESVLKAYQVVMLGIITILFTTWMMLIFEQGKYTTISLLFESVSAFATVGLSTGVTGTLTSLSKGMLMIAMFIGRVGPITIASNFIGKQTSLQSIQERVFIG
jgi:trk system potassium uptake protein TrkH